MARRGGSNFAAVVLGVALLMTSPLTLCKCITHASLLKYRSVIAGLTLFVFGAVLLWWVWSDTTGLNAATQQAQIDRRNSFGIGFETITMVVGVLAAAIAIVTLLYGSDIP